MQIQIRWADIDQNRHLRHSVYYDYGAMARMHFLATQGLTTHKLEELNIGPILFREEAIFRREIKLEDKIAIEVLLSKATQDYSRWSLQHKFMKEGDTLAATLTVDGAWMDLGKRKLTLPPDFIRSIFDSFPKAETFAWSNA